jgi:hypothetical protein
MADPNTGGFDPTTLANQILAEIRAQGERMTALENQMATEREANREHIQVLQGTIASLRETVTAQAAMTGTNTPGTEGGDHPINQVPPAPPQAPRPAPPAAPPTAPPAALPEPEPERRGSKMTMPDPPRFDGTRKKFRSWRLEMEGKLRADGHVIGSPSNQFAYIYSRLGDLPQATSAAFYERGGADGQRDPAAFMRYLTLTYQDPNIAQEALNKVSGMTQGDRESFAAFLPRFERELADAGGALWTDDVRINYLKKALNEEMTDRLVGNLHLPTNYDGYVRELYQLGTNLSAQRAARKRGQKKTPAPPPQPHAEPREKAYRPQKPRADPDEMDWEPAKISKLIRKQDKELAGKRAKWVDKAEMDLRAKEGRCFRCGRSGCRVERCPLLPARNPRSQPAVRAKKSRPVVEAAVEEESGTEDDWVSEEDDDGDLKE